MNKLIGVFLMLLLSLLFGCEREKAKLDREVDRLCMIDGGVRVYERVMLSPDNFGPRGEVFPQYQQLTLSGGRFGPSFTYLFQEIVMVAGNPELVRSESKLIRNTDRKLLGTFVNYSRRGGDLPGPWQPSARSCLDALANTQSLESQVFVRGKQQ